MSVYLIESGICLLAMLLIYRLLLAKTTLHQLKRGFLVACLVVPILLPMASIVVYYEPTAVQAIEDRSPRWIGLNDLTDEAPVEISSTVEYSAVQDGPQKSVSTFDWPMVLLVTYTLVTLFFLTRLLLNIIAIHRLANRSEKERHKGFRLILLEKVASPYSFFKYIFMGRPDFEEPEIKAHLLNHELVHVKQWHSLDVLLAELCKAIFWFNPMYWLVAKSIRLNHEFIADAGVIAQSQSRQSYQNMLLQFYQRPRVSSPLVSPTDYSFIKNRFKMMQKNTNKKAAMFRVMLLIPVLGGVLFSLAMDLQPKPQEALASTPVSGPISIYLPPDGFPIKGVTHSYRTTLDPLKKAVWQTLQKDSPYPGIDITSAPGQVVVATGWGNVEELGKNDERFGNYVLIRHDKIYTTLYASLDQLDVELGESIEKGQRLGTIGQSMKKSKLRSKVDRVHYAVSKNEEWINPKECFNLPIKELKYTGTVYSEPSDDSEHKDASGGSISIDLDVQVEPDILPFDADHGEFMAFPGFRTGALENSSSVYDNTMGTEFFSLPGTSIVATAKGTVSEIVRGHEKYGNYVVVKHNEVYETMYAKLDEVMVREGQALAKGHRIGLIGEPNEIFGRLHYKLFKNGESVWIPLDLLEKGAKAPGTIYMRRMKEIKKSYGLEGYYVPWSFPKGFAFHDIFYGQNRAVFIKSNGEAVIKDAADLSTEQKAALLSLRSQPFNAYMKKRPVPEEVYSRWEKPWVYKITIDGEYVESEKMVNYKPEDFVHCNWVVVSKAVKEKNGYAFELWLNTESYYQKLQEDRRKHIAEWEKFTKDKLSIFKDF